MIIYLQLNMKGEQKSLVQLLLDRKFGILILLFQLGMILAHAFGAYYPVYASTVPQSDYSDLMILYTLTAFLALLGYGLVIGYSDNSAITGLVTTLIVVAVSVQLTPLLLQFWYNVFNGFPQTAEVSLKTERITMALCTSLMVAMTSLVGRLGKFQTFIVIFVYNVGWTLSFQASQYAEAKKAPSTPQLYDDYGTNYIYVFAGFFAFFTSIILNIKEGRACPTGSRHSAFIALIGTGFIFACFPFTGILFPSTASANIYRRFEGPINIYFALTASVICTYISSAIFGNLKIGVRQSLVGVLSGGVMVGSVAGTITNIGGCIAIGAAAGFISGAYLQLIHPRLNASKSMDHMGIFGPILICALLGGLVVSPVMYKSMMTLGISGSRMDSKITEDNVIIFQLVYIGIASVCACGSGLIAGALAFKARDGKTDFNLDKLVSSDYGIFRTDGAEEEPERDETAERQGEELEIPPPTAEPLGLPNQDPPNNNETNTVIRNDLVI